MGVATFSVLSFIYSHANAILYGVSQGLQPLWGQAFGRKDKLELRSDFRTGMKINLIFSNVIYILLVLFRVQAVTLFNSDLALVEMASKALPVFALLFFVMSVNPIFSAYFYSIKQTVKSDIIALSRGVVFMALAIFVLPILLGVVFVWLAVLVAEVITLITV